MNQFDTLLIQNPSVQDGLSAFTNKKKQVIYGLSGSQKTFLFSRAVKNSGMQPTVVIVHDNRQKEMWLRDMAFFLPQVPVYTFPIAERVDFTTVAHSLERQAAQMEALSHLVNGDPIMVVADIEEATQYVVDPSHLQGESITLSIGTEVERNDFLAQLVAIGYEREEQVEQRGHFAVRGDIIDIFPVNSEWPIRMEFFGDEIDTMRTFSVETQRSIDTLDSVTITPFYLADADGASTLLSYGASIIWDEPMRLQESLKKYLKEDAAHRTHHCDWSGLERTIEAPHQVAFTFMQQRSIGLSGFTSIGIQGKSMTSFERQMPLLMDEIKQWQALKKQVVLVLNNQQRKEAVIGAMQQDHIGYTEGTDFEHTPGVVLVLTGLLTDGFELPNSQLVVVTEGNIFGQQKKRLRKKAAPGQKINYFTDLSIGDYVVHNVHGIGKYVGLKTIELNGIHKDYIEIAYAGTDKLFLPADHLDQIQKYIGNEGDVPKIHKMGGTEWKRVKGKAQKSIDDLAEKLVELYAKREVTPGFAFLPDQPWQREFEDAFPYEETPDQLQSVEEIKRSMERPVPMDRLLCGDVGFGKTEVAMRAIFKAVMSGKQVAVLVPTTVLSQQHFQTFFNRFAPFGVKVEVINRFRTTEEKRKIMKDVEAGQVDVLIGTHSLLNKKLQFKDLGMLVVDEEQRFGVAQKEKWKSWANNIDVLTLSATPIPRTLHMSLVGVREMSVINTPPEDRLPVQTYVIEFDMKVVTEAIRRELQRGGQVYFVYNRVASIERMADMLSQAMPDLRFAIAHGQMTGRQMEDIMTDFYEGQYDLLLCTSIIETGLDIPNANTILIYDADQLGLSQLYQMRGRVGRSARRAYAYFMYRPDKSLSETAEKRLKAIEEFTELGAGYKLAMRDLEIRGAGNLLGSQQHGNIASVGFGTYAAMLEEAIAKAQHKTPKEMPVPAPSVDLQVDAYIDDKYMKDGARKIAVYQRLLHLQSIDELNDITDELIDRFGTPTEPVDRLLRMARIREEARQLGIKSIQYKDNRIYIVWRDESKMANWDMGAVDSRYWKRMKVTGPSPTTVTLFTDDFTEPILTVAEGLMRQLQLRTEDKA